MKFSLVLAVVLAMAASTALAGQFGDRGRPGDGVAGPDKGVHAPFQDGRNADRDATPGPNLPVKPPFLRAELS